MHLVRTVLGLLVALAGAVTGVVTVAGDRGSGAPDPRREVNVAVVAPQITGRTAQSADRPMPGPALEGDRITSDAAGIARIDWFDGSVTRMGPSTTLTLSRIRVAGASRDIDVTIDTGRTWHRVEKVLGADQGRFQVSTANAVAAVRGTRFGVGCLASTSCVVAVVEGLVEVRAVDGASHLVGPQSQVSIEGTSVSEPSPIALDGFLNDAIEADFVDGIQYPEWFTPTVVDMGGHRTLQVGGRN